MRGLLFALALCPALVFAGEGEPAENEAGAPAAEGSTADEAYNAGVEHFKARRFKDAIREFNKAYRANPHPVLVFNMARCFEELKNYEAAVDFYQKYLKMNPDAADKSQVKESIATLKLLVDKRQDEQRFELQITSEPSGARLFLNGREVGITPFKQALVKGTHFVTLEADGYIRSSGEVELTDKAVSRNVTLVTLPPEQKIEDPKGSNMFAWTLVAAGGAMLVGSGVMGYQALDRNNKLDEYDRKGGVNEQEYDETKDEGRTFSYAADGLLLGGTASLLTGGYLLLTTP